MNAYTFIDTHSHIDGEEFAADRDEVVARAKAAGLAKIFVPAINLVSVDSVLATCRRYPDYAYPMVGLHPEEVKADWREQLEKIKSVITNNSSFLTPHSSPSEASKIIAVGEVGLDFYWSREFEHEQLEAFEEQVKWSIETRLPLMIHCRKAQNEMVSLLKHYERELPGGVFHCFTGNEREAQELLRFDNFALGIGGVLTFKKSHLPEVLPTIPLDRIVLETDSPYMAPVPMRGQRNESAYVAFVLKKMAEVLGASEAEIARITTATAERIFSNRVKKS